MLTIVVGSLLFSIYAVKNPAHTKIITFLLTPCSLLVAYTIFGDNYGESKWKLLLILVFCFEWYNQRFKGVIEFGTTITSYNDGVTCIT